MPKKFTRIVAQEASNKVSAFIKILEEARINADPYKANFVGGSLTEKEPFPFLDTPFDAFDGRITLCYATLDEYCDFLNGGPATYLSLRLKGTPQIRTMITPPYAEQSKALMQGREWKNLQNNNPDSWVRLIREWASDVSGNKDILSLKL